MLSLQKLSDPDGPPVAEFSGGSYPFFSPDSSWLCFFAGRELKKVSVLGGPAQTLAPATGGRGGSWGDDGRIVFSPSWRSGLSQGVAQLRSPAHLSRRHARRRNE
jgi:hypothetical protein